MILPLDTIAAGTHVALDVRSGRLVIARADGMTVIVQVYRIADQNVTLDMYEYVAAHCDRFASVCIR